jgi:hypothetical protein
MLEPDEQNISVQSTELGSEINVTPVQRQENVLPQFMKLLPVSIH